MPRLITDRDTHVELRIGAFSEIDGAHPAAAKLPDDAIGADVLSIGRHRRRDAGDVRRRLSDEVARLLMRLQQAFEVVLQVLIAAARTGHECLSVGRCSLERGMEHLFELVPAPNGHDGLSAIVTASGSSIDNVVLAPGPSV